MMRFTLTQLVALGIVLWTTVSQAAPNCPPLGPVFPNPTNWTTSATLQAAIANLTGILKGFDTDDSQGANITSYGLEVFSARSSEPLFSWYHTASNLSSSNDTIGLKSIDRNTVFKIGSLTKVFTVFTWLIQDGDVKWNEPITKYVPELAAAADRAKADPINNADWNSITIGSLASQMSGLIRDYGLGELTLENNQTVMVGAGFPPLADSDPMTPHCGDWPICNRTQFFDGLLRVGPSYAPSTTPAYANTAYQIMAYALENIKGKPFRELVETSVFQPLNLTHTYYDVPPNYTVGVIPSPWQKSGWFYTMGDETPASNIYSSVGDIADLGRAILKSTLIPPAMTRRWLKPVAMTTDYLSGLSSPFGFRRVILPMAHGHRTIDSFNKAGRTGFYSSLLVLLPDFEIGFSILITGSQIPANTNTYLANLIGWQLIPALDAAARESANVTYAGFFYNTTTNSSIYLTTTPERPGLGVEYWISNGTAMKYIATTMSAGYTPQNPSIRLYPSGLETVAADGSKKVAFKAIYEDDDVGVPPISMFATDCYSWVWLASAYYGTYPIDQFVFHLDPTGKVVAFEAPAWRVTMQKYTNSSIAL